MNKILTLIPARGQTGAPVGCGVGAAFRTARAGVIDITLTYGEKNFSRSARAIGCGRDLQPYVAGFAGGGWFETGRLVCAPGHPPFVASLDDVGTRFALASRTGAGTNFDIPMPSTCCGSQSRAPARENEFSGRGPPRAGILYNRKFTPPSRPAGRPLPARRRRWVRGCRRHTRNSGFYPGSYR